MSIKFAFKDDKFSLEKLQLPSRHYHFNDNENYIKLLNIGEGIFPKDKIRTSLNLDNSNLILTTESATKIYPSKKEYGIQKIDIVLVKNYAIQMESTFPSGHSLTATIIAMMLSLLTTNRWLQVFFGLLFPSIAISRIYLSRHFAIDTVGGSMIGFFIFIFTYYIINSYNNSKLDQKFIKNGESK